MQHRGFGDELALLRRMLSSAGVVNLVGPLGVGKSALVRALPGAVVVDLDTPTGYDGLDSALSSGADVLVVDSVDSPSARGHLESMLTGDVPRAPRVLLIVSRRPWRALPLHRAIRHHEIQERSRSQIAALVAEASVVGADADAVVTLSGGIALLADTGARAVLAGAGGTRGAVADAMARVVTQRLARERPTAAALGLLRPLATMRSGDEALLRVGAGVFDALAALTVVDSGPSGLRIAEPFRSVFEASLQWRNTQGHARVRRRASKYRLARLTGRADLSGAAADFEDAVFLHGNDDVRGALFPPGRSAMPIRAATDDDGDDIGRLIHQWALNNSFDPRRCDRIGQRWMSEDIAGFHIIGTGDRNLGLIRLVEITDRTAGGVEPLLQQFADKTLGSTGTVFLGAAHCPDPIAHGRLLRHIISTALRGGTLVVSTAGGDYQKLLRSLRFTVHGSIRDDVFGSGAPPVVFSNTFSPEFTPRWLKQLASDPTESKEHLTATIWWLNSLRRPSSVAVDEGESAIVMTSKMLVDNDLRSRLTGAIELLVSSDDAAEAEAGRILDAYYRQGQHTHVQIMMRMHLSRATYFRRLHLGHRAVARLTARVDSRLS